MSGSRNGGEPTVERNRLLTLEESFDVTGVCTDITDVKRSVAAACIALDAACIDEELSRNVVVEAATRLARNRSIAWPPTAPSAKSSAARAFLSRLGAESGGSTGRNRARPWRGRASESERAAAPLPSS